MTQKTPQKTKSSAEILSEIERISATHRASYVARASLKLLIEKMKDDIRESLVPRFDGAPLGFVHAPIHALSEALGLIRAPQIRDFATASEVLRFIESDPAIQEAVAVLDPLVADFHRAAAAEAEEEAARLAELAAAQQELHKKREEVLQRLEESEEMVEARRRLERALALNPGRTVSPIG